MPRDFDRGVIAAYKLIYAKDDVDDRREELREFRKWELALLRELYVLEEQQGKSNDTQMCGELQGRISEVREQIALARRKNIEDWPIFRTDEEIRDERQAEAEKALEKNKARERTQQLAQEAEQARKFKEYLIKKRIAEIEESYAKDIGAAYALVPWTGTPGFLQQFVYLSKANEMHDRLSEIRKNIANEVAAYKKSLDEDSNVRMQSSGHTEPGTRQKKWWFDQETGLLHNRESGKKVCRIRSPNYRGFLVPRDTVGISTNVIEDGTKYGFVDAVDVDGIDGWVFEKDR